MFYFSRKNFEVPGVILLKEIKRTWGFPSVLFFEAVERNLKVPSVLFYAEVEILKKESWRFLVFCILEKLKGSSRHIF